MEGATFQIILIFLSVALAIGWSLFNTQAIRSVKIDKTQQFESSETSGLMSTKKLDMIELMGSKIAKGANAFLFQEYSVMLVFIVIFGAIVFVVVDMYGHGEVKFRAYATCAFVIGALTSMLCGFIGMRIAVAANYRTTYMAM